MAVTIGQIQAWKQARRPIAALTAWEYATAKILDRAGADIILVGDSLAMVALGYETTLPLTLDAVIHHAGAVGRGVSNALLVVDLPFMSYQESPVQALRSAGRILKETPARAVKLEGGYPDMVETVAKLVRAGIPVMGHLGLTPQSVRLTGYQRQGVQAEAADRLVVQAEALAAAGAFAIVLEHVPAALAARITAAVPVPTIGIGAGADCDGQIVVTHDLLGLSEWQPPFAPRYADLQATIGEAVARFCADVRERAFP